MSQGETLVEVRDLVKHFPISKGIVFKRDVGAVRAVDGVSFEVKAGETLGLVGETGCGKSTTARLITRLLDSTAGQVLFEGRDITNLKGADLKAIRREMQMIFQDPYSSLNPRKTVGAIIADPFVIHGLEKGPGERKKRVQELMDRVGLNPEHYNRYPHEFSGGQRQRIGVARALALKPKLIIADEPVSALDVSIQAQILNLLRELQREFGLTMIFIAHDLAVVRHMCDRVAVMYLGKAVEISPSDTLYSHPRHRYTGALLAAVPVADPEIARRPRDLLGGDVPSPANPPAGCRFHPRCDHAETVCSAREPRLIDTGEGSRAACYFPISESGDVAAVNAAEMVRTASQTEGDAKLASVVTVRHNKHAYGKGAYGTPGVLVLTEGKVVFLAPAPNAFEIETAQITRVRRPWYGFGSYLTLDAGGERYALAFGRRLTSGAKQLVAASGLAIRYGSEAGMAAGLIGDLVAIARIRRAAQIGRQWRDLLTPQK